MAPVSMAPDFTQRGVAKGPPKVSAWSTVGARQRAEGLGSLAEALDRILCKGVSIDGAVSIGVAGVDLVMLELRLLLGAIDTVCPAGSFFAGSAGNQTPVPPPTGTPAPIQRSPSSDLYAALSSATSTDPTEGADSANFRSPPVEGRAPSDEPVNQPRPQHGLMKLALTLINLLHEVLERQAVRRMANGTLTPTQINDVGSALYAQAMEIARLRTQFGLSETDLRLSLSTTG
jgi:hypothetical protein